MVEEDDRRGRKRTTRGGKSAKAGDDRRGRQGRSEDVDSRTENMTSSNRGARRGGAGDRGDRGSGRGRGGGRGGRGDQYSRSSSSRGDRGGHRGGRGESSFRGSFSGSRDGRGGRQTHMAFRMDGMEPVPDDAITRLEDSVLSGLSSVDDLTSQMGKLGVRSKKKTGAKDGTAHKAAGPAAPAVGGLLPVRPAFGSKGRPVTVWTNYFQVSLAPVTLYKYSLSVAKLPREDDTTNSQGRAQKPQTVRGRELHLVIAAVVQNIGPDEFVATEFKSSIVTLGPLKQLEGTMTVALEAEDGAHVDRYTVTFAIPISISLTALMQYLASMEVAGDSNSLSFPKFPEAVDALNIILGHHARSNLGNVTVIGGNRYFPFGPGQKVQELAAERSRLLLAARGLFQSTRIGTGRLLLNVNVTHGVFKVSGVMKQLFDKYDIRIAKKSDPMARKIATLAKFLPKTRIHVVSRVSTGEDIRMTKVMQGLACARELKPNRARGVFKLEAGYEYCGPRQVSFRLNDGQDGGRWISVYDYYSEKYGAKLGDYPLVRCGQTDKPTFFPAEFCSIIQGQSVKAKLNMDETTTMLNFACRSPAENALTLVNDSRRNLCHDDALLDNFGLAVGKKLLAVNARILDCPNVSYSGPPKDGKARTLTVTPSNGSWNMRSVRVCKAGRPFDRWTWVSISSGRAPKIGDDVVLEFAKFMNESMGINISKTPEYVRPRELSSEVILKTSALDDLFGSLKENNIQLVLVILPEKDPGSIYSKIKTLGDCTYGIHTSCVVGKSIVKRQPGYYANVGLKINLKAGGVNHRLQQESEFLTDGKTMIVGYDVTHPTNMSLAQRQKTPSLVGLVASVDGDFAQWPAVSWEQSSGQEMLSSVLSQAFMSRLQLWKKHNHGASPENVIIFRDGVSEGQFSQVISNEIPFIREACEKICSKKPKLSMIVSVKRHQTRFYPTDEKEMSNSGNIKNGTVIDRGITQARYWDFYLTAHDALQGTARPAHYTVLLDEIFRAKYKADAANQLERLTHELCYLFGRATKAVSICPPAYYADIVCTRARSHRPEYFEISDTESISTAENSPFVAGNKEVHHHLRDTMYYI